MVVRSLISCFSLALYIQGLVYLKVQKLPLTDLDLWPGPYRDRGTCVKMHATDPQLAGVTADLGRGAAQLALRTKAQTLVCKLETG